MIRIKMGVLLKTTLPIGILLLAFTLRVHSLPDDDDAEKNSHDASDEQIYENGKHWYYRKDLKISCLMCQGNVYLVHMCTSEQEESSYCLPCPFGYYQKKKWHQNRQCVQNTSLTQPRCPDEMYFDQDTQRCSRCPQLCPHGISKLRKGCRQDGSILCLSTVQKRTNKKSYWLYTSSSDSKKIEQGISNETVVPKQKTTTGRQRNVVRVSKEFGESVKTKGSLTPFILTVTFLVVSWIIFIFSSFKNV
ncbi:uncharacterized protein LOC101860641 isoform X1 [Aplysia californica]|uniref:Uncharacterized protein LOC101860641 isoform X1 n=1 Tax=Aplysia californica TaxID=6500 RepID=A0ABM1VR96_APLCA|nr:uncharacterized protein LOC101860641 isoform X1 [Aplysia californica]